MENNGLGGKSIILRLEMNTQEIKFGEVASAIFEAGGDMVAIDVIQASGHITVRDITITVTDSVDIRKNYKYSKTFKRRSARQCFGPHFLAASRRQDRNPAQNPYPKPR